MLLEKSDRRLAIKQELVSKRGKKLQKRHIPYKSKEAVFQEVKNIYLEGLGTISRIASIIEMESHETENKIRFKEMENSFGMRSIEKRRELQALKEKHEKTKYLYYKYRGYFDRENDYSVYDGETAMLLSIYLAKTNIDPLSFSDLEMYLLVDMISYFAKEADVLFQHVTQYPEKHIILPISNDKNDDFYIGKDNELYPIVQYISVVMEVVRKLSGDNILKMLEILSQCITHLQSLQYNRQIRKRNGTFKNVHPYLEIVKRTGFFYEWIKEKYDQSDYSLVPDKTFGLQPEKESVRDNKITQHIETFDFFALKEHVDNVDIKEFDGISSETLFNTYILSTLTFYPFEHVYYDDCSVEKPISLKEMLEMLTSDAEFLEYI